ncbi:unnamed protein product [Rhizophagus irregularis]|nr:unnamed protein product [Rhizophagus irregularis]
MQRCWYSDPKQRPIASNILINCITTKIIESPDIGSITSNLDAIYKSRPLSAMTKSAKSTRNLKSQKLDLDIDNKIQFINNDYIYSAMMLFFPVKVMVTQTLEYIKFVLYIKL